MRPMSRTHAPCNIRPARLLLALALACGSALAQTPAAQPSAYEMESWRAASSINTADAYRAYLSSFPAGAFAAFARAALDKLGAPVAAGTAPAAAAAAAPAAAAAAAAGSLAEYNAESETNIVALNLGDKLNGPGVLTIGSFGTRRQLVLPRGEWILLAGYDFRSANQVPVPMSSLAFGQFKGNQLSSLLVASFNRRNIAPVGGTSASLQAMGMVPRWVAAEQCEASSPRNLHLAVTSTARTRHCAAMRPIDAGEDPLADAAALKPRIEAALKQMQGQSMRFDLRSEVHITDHRLNYLAYTRLDCAAAAAGGGSCAPSPAGSPALNARIDWLKAFMPLAVSGHGRELDIEDIRPGRPAAPNPSIALPL
jgi:hypothetical protein